MIVEAIDKRTGKTVKIEEAYPGQRLTCPYCGVDVYPVLGVITPFFRCYEGGKHKHYLCEQLDRTKRAYDPKQTNYYELFDYLFHPVSERDNPHGEPEEDEGLDASDPEDGDLSGDESKQDTGGDTDDGDEAGESEIDSGPKILPCRTLRQLWEAGIDKIGPDKRIGSCLRSDIFLWYKDFREYLANSKCLGKRILAVRPLWPVNKEQAILFDSFSKNLKTNEYRRKYFVLEFRERKEYNKTCKKLFSLNTDEAGTSRTMPKYSMVLVAGDWTELDSKEAYNAFGVKTGKNICGVQSSLFYSKNQIYPIRQYKNKK